MVVISFTKLYSICSRGHFGALLCLGAGRPDTTDRGIAMQDGNNGQDNQETPDSAARYIAMLADELAKLAVRNGLNTLGYILEMARLEADQVSKH
jgi:hypothetical protein